MSVHPTASRGYAVAGAVGDYERTRPAYPTDALDALCTALGLAPTSAVVELGAGTGKFTRMLAPRVGRMVAVEPVEAMRNELASAVAVPIVAGTAEAVPLADACADAVVAATAFHWFRADEALAEIRRLLRPGGGLGLVWNNPDRSSAWVRQVWTIVDEHRGSTPGNRDMRWHDAFVTAPGLTPLAQRTFRHSADTDLDGLVARVASISFVAALPEGERRAVLEQVRSVAATHPDLAGRSAFELPYLTELYWCHKC